MKIKDLTPNAKNPRTITDRKRAMLKKALAKFGDLSGIIYNRQTQQLVGGHQRREAFDPEAVVTVVKKYGRPTKTGTVAEGYVELKGERFAYREVFWPKEKEMAANIAANKGAGEWDLPVLNEMMKDLSAFDLNFDLDLTMFDSDELIALPDSIEVSAHTRVPGAGKDEDEEVEPAKCKAGEVYALGSSRLKCGVGELHFCDAIIAKWEKQSGEEARLLPKTKVAVKKTAQQAESSLRG